MSACSCLLYNELRWGKSPSWQDNALFASKAKINLFWNFIKQSEKFFQKTLKLHTFSPCFSSLCNAYAYSISFLYTSFVFGFCRFWNCPGKKNWETKGVVNIPSCDELCETQHNLGIQNRKTPTLWISTLNIIRRREF